MTPTTRLSAWAARSLRLPAAVGLPLTAALLASGLAVGPAGQSHAEEAGDGVRILLDEVDPIVMSPGQPVTLRGRLVNDGPAASRLTSLTVAAAQDPLSSRQEVTGWVDGTDGRAADRVLGDDALGTVLPAGAHREFEISIPGSVLMSLPLTPSVLGVELTATAGDEDDRVPLPGISGPGVLRTVLTSTGRTTVDVPLQTTWVVPLTLPADPDLSSPDDTRHTAAWLAAVGSGSTVRSWLDHLQVPDVTWLVDPAALVAHRPADGLAVPAADPADPGDGADDADDEPDAVGPEDSGRTEEPTTEPAGRTRAPGQVEGPTGTATPPAGAPASPAPDAGGTDDDDVTPGDEEDRTAGPDDETATTGPVPVPPPEPQPEPEPEPEPEDLDGQLTQLRETLEGVDPDQLWWLPTDDPDLVALTGEDTAPPAEVVADLLTRTPPAAPDEVASLLQGGRRDVAWPALAAPTADDVAGLAELFRERSDGVELGVVLLPRESFTAASDAPPRLGAVPLGDQPDVLAVGADSWTSGLVAGSAHEAAERGAGAAAQRVLAHTLGTWLEAPGNPRTVVIAPPRGTRVPAPVLDQLSEGWARARWLQPVGAEEVLARSADHNPVALSGVGPQSEVLGPLAELLIPAASPVTDSRVTSLVDLGQDLDGLAEVLQDTDALRSWHPVLASFWSTRWREAPDPWEASWRRLRQEVRTTRGGVYLLPSNVNFLADQGVIHVTVVNDLPVGVEDVRLRLVPDNGRLQITGEPGPVAVGPGSRASVPFAARAITRGETNLSVRTTTPSGMTLGQDARVAVRVQPTGVWFYWVLGGLAGLVLVLGLGRALRSSARRPRAADLTAYPDPSPSPSKESPQ